MDDDIGKRRHHVETNKVMLQAKSPPTSFPGSSLFLYLGRKREDPGNEVDSPHGLFTCKDVVGELFINSIVTNHIQVKRMIEHSFFEFFGYVCGGFSFPFQMI